METNGSRAGGTGCFHGPVCGLLMLLVGLLAGFMHAYRRLAQSLNRRQVEDSPRSARFLGREV